MSDAATLALIVACLLSQGFFSGSEIALVSADRLRLRAEAEAGRRSAKLALSLLERPTLALGTCLVGTNLSLIGTATLAVLLAQRHLSLPGGLVGLVAVPFTLTLGEMVPKALYQHHADRLVHVVIYPLRVFAGLFSPALVLLDGIYRLLGGVEGDTPRVTRQELRLLLEDAPPAEITPSNRQLIRRVFAFTEARVEEVMVPLIQVRALPADASLADAAALISETGHSRLPGYRERVDDIVGIVLHQDLLAEEDWSRKVGEIARSVPYVPESKPIDALLLEMQGQRQRMAVVVDEYGGATGIITVEDMLEEIVGDIEDESDRAGALVRRTGENEWTASGRAEREHLEATVGLTLPEGDYETVAGYVLDRMGRVPRAGESVSAGDFTIEVSRATERAVTEVKIRRR